MSMKERRREMKISSEELWGESKNLWVEPIVTAPHLFRSMQKACEKIANRMDRMSEDEQEIWVPRTTPELIFQFKLEYIDKDEIEVSWSCNELKLRKDIDK